MKKKDYLTDSLGLREELTLKGENIRSLGDLGLFAGEIFESDFRRVDDALSLLNGSQNQIDLETNNLSYEPKAPVLQ